MITLKQRISAAVAAFREPPVPPTPPVIHDPKFIGLADFTRSGWLHQESDTLAPHFTISSEDVIVEVGCGSGAAAKFYAPRCKSASIIDIEPDIVRNTLAELPANCQGYCANIEALPLNNNCANTLIAMEVLEHTDNPQRALGELYRVASPGARLLLTVPSSISEQTQKDWAPAKYFEKPNHIHCFDEASLKSLCEEAGFVVQHQMRWGFYWSVALLLHWISQRENGIPLDGAALDSIKPPFSDLMIDWAQFWQNILHDPERRPLVHTLNQVFPRNIGIVALKPA
jgi:SAM-dependent methyltransferase